ncbi:MAG: hypothetical protein FVQ85_18565 [Planctomycetes bacterium]|nr:hypothetical protein [Planctomycetota bacterium]
MRILVECNADEAVLRALGVTKKQLLHFGGKGNVINRLKELPGTTGYRGRRSCQCPTARLE